MRAPVLPPLYHPAAVGDGKILKTPSRLPEDLRPVANPQPGDPGSDTSHEQVLRAIRQIAGEIPYEQQAPDHHHEPIQRAPLPAATNAPTGDTTVPAVQQDESPAQEPAQDVTYEMVDGVPRYLHQTPYEGGAVATDATGQRLLQVGDDGEFLLDGNGDPLPIWVDLDGYESDPPATAEAPAGRVDRMLNRIGSLGRTDEDETPKVQLYDEAGVPVTDMEVVKAGAPLASSNKRRGTRIFTAAIAVMFAFGGMTLIVGVVLGSSRVPSQGAISANEAEQYRLTTFPVQQAAAFGADYLRLCLTHGDRTQVAQRANALEAMSSPATATGCGWESGGNTQAPESVTFNGEVTEIEGFPTGRAAYLGYNVALDGKFLIYNVPVWIGPTEGGGDATQVIGDIGLASTMPNGAAPSRTPQKGSDTTLASQLNSSVLQPFFTAWASSDSRQLNLMLSRNATTAARTGMDGVVTRPILQQVLAFTDRANPTGEPVNYVDGDAASLEVSVIWDVVESQSSQAAGYRLDMVMEGGQWRVADISPGLASSRGGQNSRAGTGTPGSDSNATRSYGSGTAGDLSSGDSGGLAGLGSDTNSGTGTGTDPEPESSSSEQTTPAP